MEEFRNKTLTEITKKELQATHSDFNTTSACALANCVDLDNTYNDEDDEEQDALAATFTISDGKRELKVRAYKDYWALQRWSEKKDKDTQEVVGGAWKSFKYFANLGQLANRVFDFRLKNSDVANLNELTEIARKMCREIKEEFEVELKGVKK